MVVEEVTYKEYFSKVDAKIFFNSAKFNFLNKNKVDRVRYLLFKDKKYRFGLCVGQKDDLFAAPFSAPFATFVNLKNDWSILQLEDAVRCFDDFVSSEKGSYVKFTLPPAFYAETLISAIQNILLRIGYKVKYHDLNFSLKLDKKFVDEYTCLIPSNGRKNLNNALKNNLHFCRCETPEEKKIAYDIIKLNRQSRGYPLRMTWDQVNSTIDLVRHDFFIVNNGNENLAAAVVFHVTNNIVQVIYWGDNPTFSALRPTNFLAYKLIQYYSKEDIAYLDIGISTEFGVPNYGLCDFKRSIGCNINAKFTFEKIYSPC